MFNELKLYKLSPSVLAKVLHLFDENVKGLTMLDEHNYELSLASGKKIVSDKELVHFLSSGTTKDYFFTLPSSHRLNTDSTLSSMK